MKGAIIHSTQHATLGVIRAGPLFPPRSKFGRGPANRLAAASAREEINSEQSTTSSTSTFDAQLVQKGVVAAVCVCSLATAFVGGAGPAHAEERPWRPRRHMRRLGETFEDNWADQAVQVCSKAVALLLTAAAAPLPAAIALWLPHEGGGRCSYSYFVTPCVAVHAPRNSSFVFQGGR